MRYEKDELQSALNDLEQKESTLKAILGALIGLVPAAALFILVATLGLLFAILFLLPAYVLGWFARYCGQAYHTLPRVLVALIAGTAHLAGCELLELHIFVYLMTPLVIAVAYVSAGRKLERVHQFALEYESSGKIESSRAKRMKLKRLITLITLSAVAVSFVVISQNRCYLSVKFMSGNSAVAFCSIEEQGFGQRSYSDDVKQLIKARAKDGQPAFQYFLASILKNDKTENTDAMLQWLSKAADAGYQPAAIEWVRQILGSSERTHEETQQAVKYVDGLSNDVASEQYTLTRFLASLESDRERRDKYQSGLLNYPSWSERDLFDLAKAAETGRFYSWYNRHLQGTDVPNDVNKSVELYKYLVEHYNHSESAFRLARMLDVAKKRDEAVRYYEIASNLGHTEATGWVGEYYACTGSKEKAKEMLKKAKALGYEYAEENLEEISENSQSDYFFCSDGWVIW